MKRLYTLLAILFLAHLSWGQTNYFMTDGTVTTCEGSFQDDNSGGLEGSPYSDTDYTFTICPDNPGDVIQIEFVAFNLQTSPNPNNSDYIAIYDGDNTGENSLGSYGGNNLQGLSVTGTVNNTSGCLTFVFVCNTGNTNTFPGWEGLISCTTPCDPPTSVSAITDPIPADTLQSVSVCTGAPVTFSDVGSTAADGFTLENYIWNFDDGTVDATGQQDIEYTFDEPGEYIVTLTVEDNNGCQSLNLDPLQVLVSTIPTFEGTVDQEVCLGGEICFTGETQSYTWTALPPQVVAGETYLADGAGFSYSTSLIFDFFEPDQLLEDCDDFLSAFINMEHSYMGDLQIELECPNGTTVVLVEYPNGGGSTFLGEAVDDGTTTPGIGWDYWWTPDANNGTWGDNAGGWGTSLPSGTYESDYDLCDFVGCPLNGEWTLSVIDNLAIDNGYIFYWGIELNPALYPGVTTFTPTIGTEADSTWWEGPNIESATVDGNEICVLPPDYGEYDYTFNAINSFGCAFDTTITVSSVPGPVVDAGEDMTFCDEELELSPTVSVDGNPADCSYTFVLEDTFGDGWNGCTFDIVVNGDVLYTMDLPAGSYEEETIIIPGGAQYEIVFGAGAFIGEVSFELLDDLGNLIYEEGPGGFVDGETVFTGTCGGFGTYLYEWTPSDGLSDPNIPNPSVSVANNTTYTITVYPDGFPGCATTDDVTVEVDPLGDPGQDSTLVLCFHYGDFDLVDMLGGNPVDGGEWTDGNGNPVADPTFDTYTDLSDVYTYTVTNGGCVAFAQVDITVIPQGDPICCEFVYDITVTDPTCNGYDDGIIDMTIFESTEGGPWTVNLINEFGVQVDSQSSQVGFIDFSDIAAGDYTIELNDDGGCFMSFDQEFLEPAVVAFEVDSDTTICVDGTASLHAWSVDDPGNWSYDWLNVGVNDNINVQPTDETTYSVTATNEFGCLSLPLEVVVAIYDSLSVEIIDDTLICIGGMVDLTVLNSNGGDGSAFEYSWAFNNNIVGSGDAETHFPGEDGTYCVTITDGCESPAVVSCVDMTIEVPVAVYFESDTTKGCFPATILFDNPIDPALYVNSAWDFGDGGVASNIPQLPHTYENPGNYDVSLTIVSDIGCVYSATYENYISVFNNPTAGFSASPQPTRAPETEIEFFDQSFGDIVEYYWIFDTNSELGTSTEQNPIFEFPIGTGGLYPVSLTVTDINGCTDMATRIVDIDDFFNFYVPNAFTPNNDGINDVFFAQGTDINPDRFNIQVFNRWGEKVYESDEITEVWTGNHQTGDYFVEDGMYIWKCVFWSLSTPERYEIMGYVTVMR
jgi:gliding motility-associated-like protein